MNIRKQYAKLKIDLLNDIEKVIAGKKEDYEDKTYTEIRDYKVCIVGTVRQRLGLSPKYETGYIFNETKKKYEPNDQHCSKCKELADEFPNPIEMYRDLMETVRNETSYYKWKYEREANEQKEKYEALLCELKQHMILVHGKRIEV